MAKIIPFKAIRPTRDKAYLVSSLPSYIYKKNILTAKLESNPYTFLHVINPEFRKDNKTAPNTFERFEKVKEKFDEFNQQGIFIQDKKANYYLYRQITPQNTYVGIIAGISVEDYLNGNIKIHEHTLTEREETFKMYLEVCQFNAEPVLLTYKDNPNIDVIIQKYLLKRSEYEFCTTHRIKQDLWLIDNKEDIQAITSEFEKINKIYIADGHHRSSSSVLYAQSVNRSDKKSTKDSHNYFLSFLIAESKLKIFEYNRAINSLNGLSDDDFLNQLSEKFEIEQKKSSFFPNKIHQFSMYFNKKWYQLTLKSAYIQNNNIVQNLDSKLLSDLVLNPILGIKDLKTNSHVIFIEGTKGTDGLKKIVDTGKAKVAFGLFPVSIDQLKAVADANEIMPPKSTWIEPKMRSGLTIYDLK